MATNTFKAAAAWKPWWFTHEEVCALDRLRLFQSTPQHTWIMSDATPSRDIDAIIFKCGNQSVCVSKRINPETNRVVYDLAPQDEKVRISRTFVDFKSHFARSLQMHKVLDSVWGRIEASLKPEDPAFK